MKYLKWVGNNILFVLTVFLLVFIPLYPKRPLIDIVNTWVYIRAEDFVVAIVLFVWSFLLVRKKITLKSPLTMPILLYWAAGAIATLHGILIIFPTTANLFSNVAFLSFLRHIEYVSLFFIAWAGMHDKKFLSPVLWTIVLTLLGVVAYGVGQRYVGFPAYLTMNEEVAKGGAVQLSEMGRISSTFGGHYDLAAYLVLVIPIVASLMFGVRQWLLKFLLLATVGAGFVVLFMTVSRVSFFAVLVALGVVVFFQKRKLILFSLPFIAILIAVLGSYTPALLERFGSTVKEVDVLVHAKTGGVVGHPIVVPNTYFENKTIKQQYLVDKEIEATRSGRVASPSATIPYHLLPEEVLLIATDNPSTGENLPSGSGYINLPLSPVTKRVGYYFLDTTSTKNPGSNLVLIVSGDFIMKRALAYDLSFTTRFQGEWPHALEAFKRNIFFGSGYASVSLAVDNNYLRILAETGLIGFLTFFGLFVVIGIYMRKVVPEMSSPVARGFVIGVAAGTVGLLLNAVLIDVFEASKVAFYLWLLVGVTIAVLGFYQKSPIRLSHELKKLLVSPLSTSIGICSLAIVMFLPVLENYFIGDDFTWLRWAASETAGGLGQNFTNSEGFFYRPGTKLFFTLLYKVFWLNPTIYHGFSVIIHIANTILVFFLLRKVLKSWVWATVSSLVFLILSGYSEAIFWISSIGFLFTGFFMLGSLLLFMLWLEKKKMWLLVLSIVSTSLSLLFHEVGIVTPLLCLTYAFYYGKSPLLRHKVPYLLSLVPVPVYLFARYISNSHWLSGDYDYNLLKLPFNAIGNLLGYFMITLGGTSATPIYQSLRTSLRDNILLSAVFVGFILWVVVWLGRKIVKKIEQEDRKTLLFGVAFFVIVLLPFLGLGNITSRYSYLASIGFIILFAFFFRKFYGYLFHSSQNIAIIGTSIAITIFSLFHIIQTQKAQGDWHTAGKMVQNFVTSVDASYQDYWTTSPMTFYFVNTPIRHGDAWVFPVGLADVLWFTFRNPHITVNQVPTIETALEMMTVSPNEKAFVFTDEGFVFERKKVPSDINP